MTITSATLDPHSSAFHMPNRLRYYRRLFGAYIVPGKSHLTFWHDEPEINTEASYEVLGQYYMPFLQKADYHGHYDADGIPMLDYHGHIGLQYNPIAIAQWGLGNLNLFLRTNDELRKQRWIAASDWLCQRIEGSSKETWNWNHNFDWEYRTPLLAPWYSGLAQAQGISLLTRAYQITSNVEYLRTAERAFASFTKSIEEGGVCFTDAEGDLWFEEYIVRPPTHILNGFIWASWGIYDYWLLTQDDRARTLFASAVKTLQKNVQRFDLGFWSLYEQSGTRMPMVASSFYHRLHIIQLRITQQMTGDPMFGEVAARWQQYSASRVNRLRAWLYKAAFKICYY